MKVSINNAFHSFQIKPEYRLYDNIDKENAVFYYQAKQYHVLMYIRIKRNGKTTISFFYDTIPSNFYFSVMLQIEHFASYF